MRGLFMVVSLAVACERDERVECEELGPIGELNVDTTSGTPVFSWTSGQDVELLDINCGDMNAWQLDCSGPGALGISCIGSPLVYGEDPPNVSDEYYMAAQPLPSGEVCEIWVETRCTEDGENDKVRAKTEFIAP